MDSNRKLKSRLLSLLNDFENDDAFSRAISGIPGRRLVNPLFSLLFHKTPVIRMRAVTAMGIVVHALAESEIESARVVMRRLMWTLNDESGGIGWGSPEAMGEITARHPQLANEYSRFLISYIIDGGNYLEHEELQKGVIWGIGRLAWSRPEKAADAVLPVSEFLLSDDHFKRGLAAWTLAGIKGDVAKSKLKQLENDNSKVEIFIGNHCKTFEISSFANIIS